MSEMAQLGRWARPLAVVVTVAMALVVATAGCGRDVDLGVNPATDAAADTGATDAGAGH